MSSAAPVSGGREFHALGEKMIRRHEGKLLPFQRNSVWLADTTDEVLVAACALHDPGATVVVCKSWKPAAVSAACRSWGS